MPHLFLTLFGPPQLYTDETPLKITRRKAITLLVYLAGLTEAVTLYQDDFMAGFTLPDAPTCDEWQFFQADNLRQKRAAALAALVAAPQSLGNAEAAIPFARRAQGERPQAIQAMREGLEIAIETRPLHPLRFELPLMALLPKTAAAARQRGRAHDLETLALALRTELEI